MEIIKPIFILAPARSGTTIFYNLFTRHKDTAYPEHFLDKYWLTSWKIRLIPLMVKQQIWRYKKRPLPHEGKFWRKFYPYSTQLNESNLNYTEKNYIYSVIKAELKAFRAKRFVDRSHDFMLQIKFLNALFPDAYYIIINRDPKAVVNSIFTMMKSDWNPKKEENTYGKVVEKFCKNVLLLQGCINYYNYYIDTMKKDLSIIRNRIIQVSYENFVKDPRDQLKKIFEFTEISWYNDLKNEIPKVLELKNNEKWKILSESEQEILNKAFG